MENKTSQELPKPDYYYTVWSTIPQIFFSLEEAVRYVIETEKILFFRDYLPRDLREKPLDQIPWEEIHLALENSLTYKPKNPFMIWSIGPILRHKFNGEVDKIPDYKAKFSGVDYHSHNFYGLACVCGSIFKQFMK